jgi:hypothetical protein
MQFKLEKFINESAGDKQVKLSKKRKLKGNSTKPMNVIEFDAEG